MKVEFTFHKVFLLIILSINTSPYVCDSTTKSTPDIGLGNIETYITQYQRCGKVHRWFTQYERTILGLFTITNAQNQINYRPIYREWLMFGSTLTLSKRYSLIDINVCDDEKIVLEVMLFIILHGKRPGISVIISDVSFELTKLIAALLLTTDILLFAYTSVVPYPAPLVEHLNYAYSFQFDRLSSIRQIKRSLERNEVQEISVHVLCQNLDNDCQLIEALLDPIISSKRICFRKKVYEYTDTNLQMKVDNAVKMMNDRFMIFVGAFFQRIKKRSNYYEKGFYMQPHTYFNSSAYCMSTLSTVHVDLETFNYTECLKDITVDKHTDEYLFALFFRDYMEAMITNASSLFFHVKVVEGGSSVVMFENFFPTDKELDLHFSKISKGECPIPVCERGMEAKFDYHSTNDTYWILEYGWHCRKCQKGFFKSEFGYYQCQSCTEGFQSNNLNTGCFDPIQDKFLNHTDIESITILLFSGFCFMLIGITSFVFIRARETPAVKSSDRTMLCLQYTSCMLLDITVPVLFIGSPSSLVCILQPIVIGILLILINSITLSRLQKLWSIFQLNTKMTASEVRLTKVTQWFLIAFFIIVDAVILVISFQVKTSNILKIVSATENIRFISCNSGQHVQIQLAYLFFLLLFNVIQGLRSRSLPSNYRETIYIVCSTFVSSTVLGAMSVIYFSQRDPRWKQIILAFTILLVNIVGFSIQNFYKVYIILFRKDMNKRDVFRKMMMLRIEKNLSQQSSGR